MKRERERERKGGSYCLPSLSAASLLVGGCSASFLAGGCSFSCSTAQYNENNNIKLDCLIMKLATLPMISVD